MTESSPATAAVHLTRDELVVLHDVLGRVRASRDGDYRPLSDAALFALRPQFGSAFSKITTAALAVAEGEPQ
jgi:hypothetical protein